MHPLVPIPCTLATLAVAGLFAAIFLCGGRVAFRPGQRGYRRFLSFAAGVSVGYTFVHVLPGLGRLRDMGGESAVGPRFALWPEYSVYLWALVGFMAFHGLETMVGRSRHGSGSSADADAEGSLPWQAWVHIGGFGLYAWLLAYLMVWTGLGALALSLYAVAMGLHLVPIAGNLSREYGALYDRRGRSLLALAALAGWACGVALDIPVPLLGAMAAIVAGGVIVNAMITELPKEGEGRYGYFLAGAAVYTALLLTLSHFEEGI